VDYFMKCKISQKNTENQQCADIEWPPYRRRRLHEVIGVDDDRWQLMTRMRPGGGPALAALPAPPQNHKRLRVSRTRESELFRSVFNKQTKLLLKLRPEEQNHSFG
jgi:hypothetical protein